MALLRTAKTIAARLDRTYINRTDRPRLVRRGLIWSCCAGALVAWGALAAREGDNQYSPGKLTSAHAMWDGGQNCGWCHEPQAGGKGFQLAVTDNACLRCHDGAVHHPNQLTMVSTGTPGADGKPAAAMKSSNCVECHVEHRGHELLVSKSDATCTTCHADLLPTARDKSAVALHPNVTAFAAGQHPPFGRLLTADKKWSAGAQPKLNDPTPLKFNHSKHLAGVVKPAAGEMENCSKCHEPAAASIGGADRQYIAPVRYDRHCAECHAPAELPEIQLKAPHESLEIVRPFVRDAVREMSVKLRKQLDDMPPAERAKALQPAAAAPATPRPGAGGPFRRPPGGAAPATTAPKAEPLTPDQWVDAQLRKTRSALLSTYNAFEEAPEAAGIREIVEKSKEGLKPGEPPPGLLDPRVVEFLLVRNGPNLKNNRCDLCHELSDNAPAVKRLTETAGAPMRPEAVAAFLKSAGPTTAPAAEGVTTRPAADPPATAPAVAAAGPLDTLPTGYGAGPRLWFAHSEFDHRAHRVVSCVDCHGQAKTSALTTDVLMPTMESCAKCHTPQNAAGAGGAAANCTLCHTFHDRSKERSLDGVFRHDNLLSPKPPRPTTAPATAPAGPAGPVAVTTTPKP